MALPNAQYLGRGRVHFAPPLKATGAVNAAAYGATWGANAASFPNAPGVLRMGPGRFVGNAKGVSITPQLDTLTTPDYTNSGFGETTDVVQGVEVAMSLYGFGMRNLVDMLRAARTQSVGGPASETFPTGDTNVESDSMIFSAQPIDLTRAIVLQPSWTTWTENVHWERDAFGVRLLVGFAGPSGSSVRLDYTIDGGADTIEALDQAQVEMGIVYVGTNIVDKRPIRADFYRAIAKPVDGLEMIPDGFAELKMTFTLKPVRVAGQPRPRWFRIMRGDTPNV
jgi:hypothetical protein